MSRGRRYDADGGLNYQKVFAVIIAIIVIVMFVLIIKNLLLNGINLPSSKSKSSNEAFFTVYANDKWGVINQDGEYVIIPSYQEMIIVPSSKKDVFLCTYDINEQTGEYKTKALNSENKELFTEYEEIEVIENIDKNENLWYEENVLKVKQNGKYGLINLGGKVLLPCEYDEITALQGIENSLIIKKDNLVGLCNNTGTILIEPNYSEIKNLGETYKEGYITIDSQGEYGIINATKKQVLENKYEKIEQIYGTHLFVITEAGKQKVIDNNGEIILEEGFDEITQILENAVIFKLNEKYGVMNKSKEIQIEAKYDYLKQVKENIFTAKQNNKYGIINIQDEIQLPFEYESITYNEKAKLFIANDENYKSAIIDENYKVNLSGILAEINVQNNYIKMRVENENKYYNLKCEEITNIEAFKDNTLFLSRQNGKYGYVNKKGEVVVDYIYDEGTEQNEFGYVAIKTGAFWGSIDKDGEVIISPKYNLEDNLIINFIGKWHLGQDLNMNYYCEK